MQPNHVPGPCRQPCYFARSMAGPLFAAMHLNANLPAAYFGVPTTQVVEVGLEVEI